MEIRNDKGVVLEAHPVINSKAKAVWPTQPMLFTIIAGGVSERPAIVFRETLSGKTREKTINLPNLGKQTIDLSVSAMWFTPITLINTVIPEQYILFYNLQTQIATQSVVCMGTVGDPSNAPSDQFDLSLGRVAKVNGVMYDKFIFGTVAQPRTFNITCEKDWRTFDYMPASAFNLLTDSDTELNAANARIGAYNYSGRARKRGTPYTLTLCYTIGASNTGINACEIGGDYRIGTFTKRGDRVVESRTFTPAAPNWAGDFLYMGIYQDPVGTYGSKVHWAVMREGTAGVSSYMPSRDNDVNRAAAPTTYVEGTDIDITYLKSITFTDFGRTKLYKSPESDYDCAQSLVMWLSASGSWDWLPVNDYTISPVIDQSHSGGKLLKYDVQIKFDVTDVTYPLLDRLCVSPEVYLTSRGVTPRRLSCTSTNGVKLLGGAGTKNVTLKFETWK